MALAIEASGLWRLRALTLYDTPRDVILQPQRGQRQEPQITMRLGELWQCPSLESLTLDSCDVEGEMEHLGDLPALRALTLRALRISEIDSLARCASLQSLELYSCWRVRDVSAFSACAELTSLRLHCYKGARLVACPALRSLQLSDCAALVDLWALSACTALESLSCSICHGLKDLSPLADCAALCELRLDRCTGIRDVAPISACTSLRTLSLSRCPSIGDLSALAACTE